MTERAPGLEQRIARIEEIASALESDRLELDQALRLFEEGVGHLRAAESLLREGELRIERLLEQEDGSVSTQLVEEPEA